jgi:uncharacterized protein (TIGR02285 family)
MIIRFLFGLGLFCALTASYAQKSKITWMFYDLPPQSINVEDRPANGFVDTYTKMVVEAWPEREHEFIYYPVTRIFKTLGDSAAQACLTSAIVTPERERLYYMTRFATIPPLRLVIRKKDAPRFPVNGKGEVLAGTLFDSQSLHGGLVSSRSYSAVLDALIAQGVKRNGSIEYVSNASAKFNPTLLMLSRNRIDYTLEFGYVAEYAIRNNPEFADTQLITLAIAGTQPFEAAFACPRTPWGKETVQHIDTLLTQLAKTKAYQNVLRQWLTAEEQRYMQPFETAFIKKRIAANFASPE